MLSRFTQLVKMSTSSIPIRRPVPIPLANLPIKIDKIERIKKSRPSKISLKMSVSDISTFFATSTRSGNDAANKIREGVLQVICNPPTEYLQDAEFGGKWQIVYQKWNEVLKEISLKRGISEYTSTQIKMKGGRTFNYDADVMYYNGPNLIATRKIEFKNGGSNIGKLAQFLSLQAKYKLINETYDKFFYENYLDKYIACDVGITEPKPTLENYLKLVTKVKPPTPFFQQLKDREETSKNEKNEVASASITDYLNRYGETININDFSEKVKETQKDKIYVLWDNGKFHVDALSEAEMTGMVYDGIVNGNKLILKTGNTIYGLLLRWRNHNGILNPAWQISLKRLP